ncbi:MAG: MMPL family transporter [Planctomycetaceae bacterium]|nr:MMPL family transporter [Planctomycetaceae bacterium]
MSNFFSKRDPWGNGLSLWVFAGLLFASPLMIVTILQIRMDNDVETWLPKNDPDARVLAWFKHHFPAEDRVLVTWDGSSLNDPRVEAYVEKLIGRLDDDGVHRGGSPLIDSVITADELCTKMIECGVEPNEAAHRMLGTLIGHGLIRVRLTDDGRVDQADTVARLCEEAKQKLGIDLEVLSNTDDPCRDAHLHGTTLDIVAVEEGAESKHLDGDRFASEIGDADRPHLPVAPHDFRVTWCSMIPQSECLEPFYEMARQLRGPPSGPDAVGPLLIEDCFRCPGSPVGMLVNLSEAGRSDEGGVVQELKSLAAEVGISESALHIGGRAVTASELNEAVQSSAWNKATDSWWPHKRSVMLMTGVVSIGLAFLFLKSLRLGILVLVVSYYTTAVALTMIPLSGGNMNMVLMVMPTLLNVLTLSGAIHVANYWKHAAVENPRTAIARAVEMARQPCALASITTAIGLISLVTSDLGPVKDFGLFSAIGCLLSLVAVLYVLPTLLQLWPAGAPQAQEVDSRRWEMFGRWVTGRAGLVSGICLVACVACSYGLAYFQTETKVIRYFPSHARVVRDGLALEQMLSGTSTLELVVRFNPEMQKKSAFLERLEIVRQVGDSICENSEISGVISLADFQPVNVAPDEDARTFTKIKYNRRSTETERRVKEKEISGTEAFFAVAPEAGNLLTPGDVELNEAGEELWRITAQAGITSDHNFHLLTSDIESRVTEIIKKHPGTNYVITGTVPLFLRTQLAVLDSLIKSFGMAFAIIALVMIGQLRSPIAGLLSMLPNLMPVVVVFGLIAWSGTKVDIGSMLTASVALGIAVDGTLHLLTWFREGIVKGMSRDEAVVKALAHCGPAMWQTSAAVGFGLLMLYPADLLMISRFGWLMAALIGAALFADVVFLPALLSGPLGRIIERTVSRSSEDEIDAPRQPQSEAPQPHFHVSPSRTRRMRPAG